LHKTGADSGIYYAMGKALMRLTPEAESRRLICIGLGIMIEFYASCLRFFCALIAFFFGKQVKIQSVGI